MNLLIVKTFAVIVMMLCATAVAARRNHAFEHKFEFWGLFIGSLVLLFVIPTVSMPINIVLALVFALMLGSLIGPGIKSTMMSYVLRKRLSSTGYSQSVLATMPEAERTNLIAATMADINNPAYSSIAKDWNNVLGLALFGTAGMTMVTAVTVAVLGFDFSFLGTGLLIALLGLIVMSLLNAFWFKSPLMRLIGSYIGAVVFSLYLLYDFNQLEKFVKAGDTSWDTAISVGISIYLDIVNLFLDLLDILSSHN